MTSLSAATIRAASRAIFLLMIAAGLASCDSAPTSPTSAAPSLPPAPPPAAPPPVNANPTLTPGGLSGVVSELTADGLLPIEGVELYCDACGEFGHTWVTTDASGAYDFGGGGIWLYPGSPRTTILVHKDGYDDPGGSPGPLQWSQRYVTINGDTRFNFQLVRR